MMISRHLWPARAQFFVVVLALLLLLAGCARASQQPGNADVDDGIVMRLSVEPDPPVVGDAELTISLSDANAKKIDGASLAIKADMSHAGMVPVLANTSDSSQGQYHVALEWTMAGEWIVTVVASLPEGQVVTRRFNLSVGDDMP